MNWLRSSDISPLFAISLLVLDLQRSKKMAVRYQVLDISSGEHSMALRVTAGLNQPETGGAGDKG